MKTIIETQAAPSAIGPYSQAISCGGMIFSSGQLPVDPAAGTIPAGIAEQTKQALENLSAVLRAAGSSLEKVVKTTVFMADLTQFESMNRVYAEFFKDGPPARSTVQVARLPKDSLVEIEAIAILRTSTN